MTFTGYITVKVYLSTLETTLYPMASACMYAKLYVAKCNENLIRKYTSYASYHFTTVSLISLAVWICNETSLVFLHAGTSDMAHAMSSQLNWHHTNLSKAPETPSMRYHHFVLPINIIYTFTSTIFRCNQLSVPKTNVTVST